MFFSFFFQNVKDQMEVMKDKDTLINLRNTNHQKLLEELDNLVVCASVVVTFLLSVIFLRKFEHKNQA